MEQPSVGCSAPSGLLHPDCDDNNGSVDKRYGNCNGIDDNCNGTVTKIPQLAHGIWMQIMMDLARVNSGIQLFATIGVCSRYDRL